MLAARTKTVLALKLFITKVLLGRTTKRWSLCLYACLVTISGCQATRSNEHFEAGGMRRVDDTYTVNIALGERIYNSILLYEWYEAEV